MLYKTGVEYGDYTANYVQGCSHGCRFPCYAFSMAKRFGIVKTYEEWINPVIVSNTLELLEKELPKLYKKIQNVQLCFTTDPFMYKYDDIKELSLNVISTINKYNIPCHILTKGILPDDLLKTDKINVYGITLVSLNDEFREKYEPFTAAYEDRINSLKKLHDLGYKTWVSIEPYPTPNIIEQDLEEILDKVNFVDKIIFGRLHYNKMVSEYKEYKKFYNECADFVANYCNNHNIEVYIKNKTRT
jgi:DNA repair photolyase